MLRLLNQSTIQPHTWNKKNNRLNITKKVNSVWQYDSYIVSEIVSVCVCVCVCVSVCVYVR